MLSSNLFRFAKCSTVGAQRLMSFRALPKYVFQFNTINKNTLTKPLLSAPMLTRFAGSAAEVKTDNKNYASVWKTERIISIALMGLFPGALLYSSPILDTLLAVGTSLHVYWGLEALVVDYLRVSVVGQLANKAGHAAVTLLTIFTLAGFFQVIFMGDGLGNAITTLWKL